MVLTVEDGGDGIADAAALLDRGSSAGGSTGLGLDIATATARIGGGELRVERSVGLGGTRVVLDLPRAEDSRTLNPDATCALDANRGWITAVRGACR